ncbi:hypothetical protein DQF64_03620 [Moraxella bovis]|nr:hypothetical protein DQF64_03620 [Moraxella bovis]
MSEFDTIEEGLKCYFGVWWVYFPKHQDLSKWHERDIISKVNELNHRPKKCLNWKTPYEVYFDEVLQLV